MTSLHCRLIIRWRLLPPNALLASNHPRSILESEKAMIKKFRQWWHRVTKRHSFIKITNRTQTDCGFEDYKCTVCGAVESRFHN
jgi:hypothetical protein